MDRTLKARLEARLGSHLVAPVYQRGDETEIRIGPGSVPEVLTMLHDATDLRFEILADLAGVDTGKVMQVVYHLWSPMTSDWLRIVADGVNALRGRERSFVVITHYQRLLEHITPDVVHVMARGRIVKSGGPELALELAEDRVQRLHGQVAHVEEELVAAHP